jgi:hypothetical protein
MNLAEQTDWTDVEFAREIEAKIATINERIVEVTQHDLSDLVTGMIRDLVPVNPRPRYAPNFILEHLKRTGSQAVPGYMQPEGIVVYHRASDTCFKATIEGDESHKGQQG